MHAQTASSSDQADTASTTAAEPSATTTAAASSTSSESAAPEIPNGTIEILSQGMSVPEGGTVKGSAIITVISSKPATQVGLRFITGSRIALSAAASQDGDSTTRFVFNLADGVLSTGQYTIVAYFSGGLLSEVPFARANMTIEPAPQAALAVAVNEEGGEDPAEADAATTTSTTTEDIVMAEEDRLSIILSEYDSLAECEGNDDCKTLCYADENEALCQQFLRDIVATGTAEVLRERIGARSTVDSDSDGITDFDERAIFSTDPEEADSDDDGVSDGDELLAHSNPLMAASSTLSASSSASSTPSGDEVEFQDPRSNGAEDPELLGVHDVALSSTTTESGTSTETVFSGSALPNSYVTLFVFSALHVKTTKTDEDGNWTVAIAELEDGEHEAYAAYTTASGTILAKSEKLEFQKSPEGITIGPVEPPPSPPPPPAPKEEFAIEPWMKWAGAGAGLLAVLSAAYFYFRRRRHGGYADYEHDEDHYDHDGHDDDTHSRDHIDVHDPHVVVLPRRH